MELSAEANIPDVGDGRAPRWPAPAAAYRLLTDERLARMAAGGDRVAFSVIADRYQQGLYAYCASLVGNRDDAADALQSTMLQALRALDGEERTIAVRPWLYRIAHNESMNLLRRPRTEQTEEEHPSVLADVEASADVRAQLRTVLEDIRGLPERLRGALVMRELAGLEYDDIGAALGTTAASAKQAVYDARRALFEVARGRDTDCATIQRQLSDGDRRTIRARPVRAHLSGCMDCRTFQVQMASRQSSLASFTPALPAAIAGQAAHGALAGTTAGTAGTGITTTAGGQAVAVAAVAAALSAGAVGVHEMTEAPEGRTERAAPSAVDVAGRVNASRTGGGRAAARALGSGRAAPAGGGRTTGGKGGGANGKGGAGRTAGAGKGKKGAGPGPARGASLTVTSPAAPEAPAEAQRRGPIGQLVGGGRPRRPQNGGPVGAIVAETREPVNDAIDHTQQSLPVQTPAVPSVPGIRPPKTPRKPF
jgi:RNA polymerase sigma factor (sigma-70 family)